MSYRIQRYLDYTIHKSKKGLRMEQIKLFGQLSEDLLKQLQSELVLPTLVVHPLFEHLGEKHGPTMNRLATTSIEHKAVACGDKVFYIDEIATHIYFVKSGQLKYIQKRDNATGSKDDFVELSDRSHCSVRNHRKPKQEFETVDSKEDWIAEPVLWSPAWVHRGLLWANRESELLRIKPEKFAEVASLNPAVYVLVCGYAQSFLKWLNNQAEQINDVSQGESVSSQLKEFIGRSSGQAAESPPAPLVSVSRHLSTKSTASMANVAISQLRRLAAGRKPLLPSIP